jgi:CRISPR/Cas system-associated protein endoribonuclease Cas2
MACDKSWLLFSALDRAVANKNQNQMVAPLVLHGAPPSGSAPACYIVYVQHNVMILCLFGIVKRFRNNNNRFLFFVTNHVALLPTKIKIKWLLR